MSGYTDKAVGALLDRLQVGTIISEDGGKIADLTHADTNEHTREKADMGVPAECEAILVRVTRASGTGNFQITTRTAGTFAILVTGDLFVWPITNTGVFRYKLGTSGDDWDVHLFAYFTRGRVKG